MNTRKNMYVLLFALTTVFQVYTQEVKGTLSAHTGKNLELLGFDFEDTFLLGKTTLDSLGNFVIPYNKKYQGMGILTTENNNKLVLVLDGKTTVLRGRHLSETDRLQYVSGIQKHFVKIARAFSFNDRAYLAWNYLKKLYVVDTLQNRTGVMISIEKEMLRIDEENAMLITNLPKESYLSWYAPLRKLVSDMSQSIRNYPERIPSYTEQFRSIDFTHVNLKTSGLFNELIEGHYFMLENSGPTLDSVYVKMNRSTDLLIEQLQNDSYLLNKVSQKLFKLFEKRSLFPAAAHLSERLLRLKNCACQLEASFQKKLQKYGDLKVGKIAPDINLNKDLKLSDLHQNVLLVFGSSTCPACQKEAVQLSQFHDSWKERNIPLEIVYISLDTDKTTYETAFQNAPWKTYTDLKGWDSKAAKDYYVYATPTYLLLDKDLKVLLHPRSLAHVNAWIPGKL